MYVNVKSYVIDIILIFFFFIDLYSNAKPINRVKQIQFSCVARLFNYTETNVRS